MKANLLVRSISGQLLGALVAFAGIPLDINVFGATTAGAEEVSVNFRLALEPHGRWVSHQRWGEVWAPDVAEDWQPYSNGRWVYTEEWGWYWVANEDWGWIP